MKILHLGVVAIAGMSMVTACSKYEDRVAFDGQYFKAKLTRIDKQDEQFAVEVGPVSASLAGVREAGRFEATKYCIKQFGTSSIEWVAGPDAEDGTLRVENDKLQLRGACTP